MDSALLGIDVDSGEEVRLDNEQRLRGLYILGKTGTGKSTLLKQLALHSLRSGFGGCVLDPHGDLVDDILREAPTSCLENVALLDPRDSDFPFGINLYDCSTPDDPEVAGRTAAQVEDLFEKLWGVEGSQGSSWGPRVAQFVRNTAFTMLANPGLTMAEIPALLTNSEFRARVVARVSDPQVQFFWQTYESLRTRQVEEARSTLNKLDQFLTQPIVAGIVGQSETTVDFRRFMDEGKFVLVPLGLGRLGGPVVSLLGSLIVLEILNAALSREELPQPQRRPFHLYADEYHRFATPAFSTLLTEARKYGIATTIAHQERWQLDRSDRNAPLNAGNLVDFAVHGEDGEEMAKQADRTPPAGEPTGRREHLSISQEPLQHLARNGHHEKVVRDIMSRRFNELVFNATGPTDASGLWSDVPNQAWAELFFDEGGYHASRATLYEGVRKINRYLVDLTENRLRLEESGPRILEILLYLRAYFRIATYEEPANAAPFQSREERIKYQGGVRHVSWIKGMGEDELRGIIQAELKLNFDPQDVGALYGAKRLRFWEAHLETLMGRKDPAVKRRIAQERAVFEAMQAVDTVKDLIFLGALLSNEPVMVPSGQWESTGERARTYSDVREEIANRLVNQANFRAFCKILVNDEPHIHWIRLPALLVQDEAHRNQQNSIKQVRAQSRAVYGRPRAMVEQAMAARIQPSWQPVSRVISL